MRIGVVLAWIIAIGILLSFTVTVGAMLYQLLLWPPYSNVESAANFQINLQIMEILGLYAVTGAIIVIALTKRTNRD